MLICSIQVVGGKFKDRYIHSTAKMLCFYQYTFTIHKYMVFFIVYMSSYIVYTALNSHS